MKMKTNKFADTYFNYILYGIFFIAFLVVLNKPVEILKDSTGYMEMSLIRLPVYPIFLYLVHKICGDIYLSVVVFLQFLLLIIAAYNLIKTLRNLFPINNWWFFLLAFLVLLPALYNINVCNRILSESLAYPLYLIVFAHLIKAFVKRELKPLLYAIPLLLLLLLVRGQFIFIVGGGILVSFYILWKQKNIVRKSWIIGLFLILPILAGLMDKTYHFIVHHHFVATPWTGIHLLTPALFVANKENVSVFSTEEEKGFFKQIFDSLENKNLTLSTLKEEDKSESTIFYIQNFTKITNATIFNEGRYFFKTPVEDAETFIKLDTLSSKMTFPLVKKNFGSWAKLYIQNFNYGLDGAKYVLMYVLLCGISLFFLFRKNLAETKFIFLGSLFVLLNVAVIAIGMHTIKRFTFYNDWILFFILFLLLDRLLTKKLSNGARS